MIIRSQLVHSDLSLPAHRIDLLRVCTTFHHNPTLADSQYTISSSVDVESFRVFANAVISALFDISHGNIIALEPRRGVWIHFLALPDRGPWPQVPCLSVGDLGS
jgi:hypothetical protein